MVSKMDFQGRWYNACSQLVIVHEGKGEGEERYYRGHEILLQQPFNYDEGMPVRFEWNWKGECVFCSLTVDPLRLESYKLNNKVRDATYAFSCPVNGGCEECDREGQPKAVQHELRISKGGVDVST